MTDEHVVINTDERFIIDVETRTIKQTSGKSKLMQYDHNSERYEFEMPRRIDNHDMSLCNKVQVNYINVSSDRSGQSKGPYLVTDLKVDPNDDEKIVFSWLISRNSTVYAGTLNFNITFKCLTDAVVDYAWSTDVFTDIKISAGIDNDSEEYIENYADILEQWKHEVIGGVVQSVNGKTGVVELTASDLGAQPVGDYALKTDISGGGNTIIGVIDSHYYNFRLLNEERGATMAEIREAALNKDKAIVIRLDLDNWQGTLQYLGIVNLTEDGSTYSQVLLFSTIKMNNGVVNTANNVVSGTVQLEYWYADLESGTSMPPTAFMNCQFAEINLAPGSKHAGSFMRVNEDGLWDVEKINVIQAPTSASVGQALVVRAIDNNGKPTEWETIPLNVLKDSSGTQWTLSISTDGVVSASKM